MELLVGAGDPDELLVPPLETDLMMDPVIFTQRHPEPVHLSAGGQLAGHLLDEVVGGTGVLLDQGVEHQVLETPEVRETSLEVGEVVAEVIVG